MSIYLCGYQEHVIGGELRTVDRWAISFTPHCLCLSEETLEAVGPYRMLYMPG